MHTGKKSTRRGISGQRLRLLRLKWERVLLRCGYHEGLSQAQLARRLRYRSRSSVSKLEKQTFVKEAVAVLYIDALAAELVHQLRGIEVDFDPADWGLPPEPSKPKPTAYRDRPRDARGRWLGRGWSAGTSLKRDDDGSRTLASPPQSPVAASAEPRSAAGPSQTETLRWKRPTGVPLTGYEERALREEHAVLTGKYEREAEDLTELNRLYQVAAATGMEVAIEDDGIPEDMRYPQYRTPRESPAARDARERAERAERYQSFFEDQGERAEDPDYYAWADSELRRASRQVRSRTKKPTQSA